MIPLAITLCSVGLMVKPWHGVITILLPVIQWCKAGRKAVKAKATVHVAVEAIHMLVGDVPPTM